MDASKAGTNPSRRAATLWFRKNGDGAYEYNHLEDGHASGDIPTKKHPSQSGWARGIWIKEHAWLEGHLPVRIVRDAQATAARILAGKQAAGKEG